MALLDDFATPPVNVHLQIQVKVRNPDPRLEFTEYDYEQHKA